VRMYRLLLLVALVAPACQKDTDDGSSNPACAKAKQEGPIAWIEDDYPSALACAKARKLPLVLDLWAPWCHTCLSMKATVFRDGSLEKDARRFVFASFDTDREDNAPVVAKFPLSAWPTFYVIGTDETVLARFVGAASLVQLHAFLDAGARAGIGVDGADKHLLAAERAIARKDLATAETELSTALSTAPSGWVRRSDALGSLLNTLRKRGDLEGCLDLADSSMDQTGNAASATDFIGIAIDCANQYKAAPPERIRAFGERAAARLEVLLADPTAPLSFDDRSDAMVYLRELYDALGQKPKALAVAEKQRALLDEASSKAPSPLAAMTYIYQLADVYVYLGRPLDAVPVLEKSAKDLPTEYDPPARLGSLYMKAGKLTEAAQWTDKAIALSYGPRKARVLSQRAEIAAKQGDLASERTYRTKVVEVWQSLPPGHANVESLAKAKDALAKMDAPTAAGSAATGSGSAGSAAPPAPAAAGSAATGSAAIGAVPASK
jgi:thioredoxin-like negative regulator of GroEL